MPASRANPWLVCYDIADPRRLQRVHKTTRRYAVPFQYSVFHTMDTRAGVRRTVDAIASDIDPAEDDLRAYALFTASAHVLIGRPLLSPDVSIPQLDLSLHKPEDRLGSPDATEAPTTLKYTSNQLIQGTI